MNQEFRLQKKQKRKKKEIRNYLIKEINQNESMSKQLKKFAEFQIILTTYLLQFLQLLDMFPFLLSLF